MRIRSPAPAVDVPLGLCSETALRMAEAASIFLASLSSQQRQKVLVPMASDARTTWDYRPGIRQGISLNELETNQQQLAYGLLTSGLSHQGNIKALAIMSLERVLGDLEGPSSPIDRNPELYYITVFGAPTEEAPWAWRIEGHHLSVNFLVLDGKWIAPTPNFFGANPARVPEGPLEGLRILAAEEDLARRLLGSLGENQLKKALIDVRAPADILSNNSPRVRLDEPVGISYAEMDDKQQMLLKDLVSEYLRRVPQDVAEFRLHRIEKEGERYIHFAWAGTIQPNGPHYYRVHGPGFLAEYDNTQNNANHVHSVWRDIRDDWGDDLLERHYRESHETKK